MTALWLAIVLSCGGRVIDVQPGRALVCGAQIESSVGGSYARCEWVRVGK